MSGDDAPDATAETPGPGATGSEADAAAGDTAVASDVAEAPSEVESGPPDTAAVVADTTTVAELPHFSFFVTSLAGLQELSGSQDGFGGDLRFGETGDGAGLRGADKICAALAESSMPGSGQKPWRAFLSATTGGVDGGPVNAIDRVGQGPWYDRVGRIVAANLDDLAQVRPLGADPAIINDLPNETGTPNHDPDGNGEVDNHDTLTGSDDTGKLFSTNAKYTCQDWTTSVGSAGTPRVGHSWPRSGPGGGGGGGGFGGGGGGPDGDMRNWMSALTEAGCAAGVNLVESGPPNPNDPSVGSGGGYGGFYCFALTP